MADGSVRIDITADDSDIKKKLDDVEEKAKETGDELEDLGDSSEKTGKGFNLLDIAAGNLVANGISGLLSGIGELFSNLASLADETREYREDISKLEAAFKTAGHTTETASDVYKNFYKILGESDQSVEASNHLAEMVESQEDVAKWSDIAAGTLATFQDSLPLEALTESAKQTAELGKLTGPLVDSIERAGIGEENFNKQLAACNTEKERAALITKTLHTHYAKAGEEYNELTAETQKARLATAQMEEAQAALGAKIEPLTTAWTELKARGLEAIIPVVGTVAEGMLTLTNNLLNNKSAVDLRAEAARSSLEAVRSEAEAYRELKTAQFEQSAADLAHLENANLLYNELQGLVDVNGRVSDANKARADFILTTLNEALGTEATLTGNQILQYDTLKTSIENAIAAKQAEILLANDLAAYTEAIENRVTKEKEQAEKLIEISEQRKAVAAAESEYNKYLADFNSMLADAKTEADYRNLASFAKTVSSKQAEMEKEKGSLSKLETAYNENEELLKAYYSDISSYEEAQSLIMQGKTAEAIELLNKKNDAYYNSSEVVGKSLDEQRKKAEEHAIFTGVNAVLMRERYEKGVEGVTEAMVKTAEKAAETAKTEFEKIGGQIGDGIGKGAEDKKPGLLTKIKNIVSAMKKAAEDEADINSPSRVFRDEIGKMIVAGIEVGIDDYKDKPINAMGGVFDEMQKLLDKRAKEQIKTVADYNAEYRNENIEHAKELEKLEKDKNKELAKLDEKLAEDKKKKNADKIKLDKEYAENVAALNEKYNTSVENQNKKHADNIAKIEEQIRDTVDGKMQNLISLEKKYKEDVKKVWDDLSNEIESLQQNYDNQLKSRTDSIVSSLNLFKEATKNSVSGSELKKNLKSQVDVLEDYNGAIAKLEERNINGDFLNYLKGLGVGSTGEIEALAKMNDTSLASYIELWEKKNELAKAAATEELEPLKAETEAKVNELVDNALDKYAELRKKFTEQSALLMSELQTAIIDAEDAGYDEILSYVEDYEEAGGSLMDGVIEGIVDRSPAVTQAVTSAVRRAIEAAKAAAGIHSPSDVTKDEIGANLALGVGEGWKEKLHSLKSSLSSSLSDTLASLRATVAAENGRFATSPGVADTGFNDLARAVGVQTAGINSLAGAYKSGGNNRPVILQLNGRELGRAVVDLGGAEESRRGVKLVTGGAY